MKDIPTSPRIALLKRNQKVMRLRLSILFTLLFITVIGGVSYFSSYKRIVIDKLVITGNSIIDESKLESEIQEKLSGKYLKLFSRANFLIYPRNMIYKNLLVDFPRIEKLSIKREGLNTLRIEIKERAGSYLYCGVSVPVNKSDIGENCYFINNDGYIFDKAPYFSGDVYFKYYTSINGDITNPMGSQMIPVARFHEIIRFMDGITSLGFNPTSLVIAPDGIDSLYLKSVNLNLEPAILFKEENDLNLILDNLTTAMKQKEFANEINSKYDTLSYIDLRFKNKVLYKFQ